MRVSPSFLFESKNGNNVCVWEREYQCYDSTTTIEVEAGKKRRTFDSILKGDYAKQIDVTKLPFVVHLKKKRNKIQHKQISKIASKKKDKFDPMQIQLINKQQTAREKKANFPFSDLKDPLSACG